MNTMQGKPGVGQVPEGESQEMRRFLGTVKEHIEVGHGVRGDYRDRYVTLGMLISAGILSEAQAQQLGSK